MKSHFMSGVSARVQRWGFLMNVVLFGGLMVGLSLASAAPKSNVTLVAQCIPSNDRLSGPLGPFMGQVVGAIGGLIPAFLVVLVILVIITGMWKISRNEDMSDSLKKLVGIVGIVLGGIAVLIVVSGVYVAFNNLCTTNPFN